jgi:hexokinase
MGKGFAITSNLDLAEMLLKGYDRHITVPTTGSRKSSNRNLPCLKISAITNDTVATLVSLAYSEQRVAMGLIVGTGTNAAIPMKLKDLRASKWPECFSTCTKHSDKDMAIVNTEWTIKGAAPPLKTYNLITKWDTVLDEEGDAPGFQPFEYMTAGRYLGELARLVILDVFTSKLSYKNQDMPQKLQQRFGLTTTYLGNIPKFAHAGDVLSKRLHEELPPPQGSPWQWNDEAAAVVLKVARLVEIRASGMVASAIIGLFDCAGELQLSGTMSNNNVPKLQLEECTSGVSREPAQAKEELVVAYTGGAISHIYNYLEDCQRWLEDIMTREFGVNSQKVITLRPAHDGGIIGAGVLAGTVASHS